VSRGRSGLLVVAVVVGVALAAVATYGCREGGPSASGGGTGDASPAPGRTPASTAPSGSPSAPALTGQLRIVADVPGAAVFFDHNFEGRAPVEIRNVAPGSHRLNVSAEGREMYAETLETGPGPRTVIVRLPPLRLDVAVDVVHRHGLGSCEGRLSATSAGVRYDTTDKDDAFLRPLAELEPLQIDTAKKNLRVRVRKGKTYNFTTKAPNADDLETFRQKVEAARRRD
jgi:hypothetical protein